MTKSHFFVKQELTSNNNGADVYESTYVQAMADGSHIRFVLKEEGEPLFPAGPDGDEEDVLSHAKFSVLAFKENRLVGFLTGINLPMITPCVPVLEWDICVQTEIAFSEFYHAYQLAVSKLDYMYGMPIEQIACLPGEDEQVAAVKEKEYRIEKLALNHENMLSDHFILLINNAWVTQELRRQDIFSGMWASIDRTFTQERVDVISCVPFELSEKEEYFSESDGLFFDDIQEIVDECIGTIGNAEKELRNREIAEHMGFAGAEDWSGANTGQSPFAFRDNFRQLFELISNEM